MRTRHHKRVAGIVHNVCGGRISTAPAASICSSALSPSVPTARSALPSALPLAAPLLFTPSRPVTSSAERHLSAMSYPNWIYSLFAFLGFVVSIVPLKWTWNCEHTPASNVRDLC
jgi:hypothetical protein